MKGKSILLGIILLVILAQASNPEDGQPCYASDLCANPQSKCC